MAGTTATIGRLRDGRIYVVAPYSAAFVAEAHRLMGRWGEVRRPDGAVSAWKFAAEHEARVREACARFYPTADALEERTITFRLPTYGAAELTIDGARVLSFARDWRGRITHEAVVEVMDDRLTSGGSRADPKLYGSLTVRVRVRPGCEFSCGDGAIEDAGQVADEARRAVDEAERVARGEG